MEMRCLDCKAQFKRSELQGTANHCPSCGYEIITLPHQDGIGDGKITKLATQLSNQELYRFAQNIWPT